MRFAGLFLMLSAGVSIVGVWLRAAPPPALSIARSEDSGVAPKYEPWIDEQISSISGDDANEQRHAADQLALVIPVAADRAKVLAALAPHLTGNDKDFRQKCVLAYAHWATVDQTRELLNIVANPPSPPEMSGDEPGWGIAAAALVNLNPRAAEAAVEQRRGRFFFRDAVGPRLVQIASENSPGQPVAFALIGRIDESHSSGAMPFPDALRLLRSDSANDRGNGARALALSVIDPAERATILGLLKSHLMGKEARARFPFVKAYAHWATAREVPQLKAIIAFPEEVDRRSAAGHDDCWAAATVGLARFDPLAAKEAAASRAQSGFYTFHLQLDLKPIAQGNGPMQPIASWLLGQLEARDQIPLPPDFSPERLPSAPKVSPQPAGERAAANESNATQIASNR